MDAVKRNEQEGARATHPFTGLNGMNNLARGIAKSLIFVVVISSLLACSQESSQSAPSTVRNAGSEPQSGGGANLQDQLEKISAVFVNGIVNAKPDVIVGLWSQAG